MISAAAIHLAESNKTQHLASEWGGAAAAPLPLLFVSGPSHQDLVQISTDAATAHQLPMLTMVESNGRTHVTATCDPGYLHGAAIVAMDAIGSLGIVYSLSRSGSVLRFQMDPSPWRLHCTQHAAKLPALDYPAAVVCAPNGNGFAALLGSSVYIMLSPVQRICLEDKSSPIISLKFALDCVVTLSANHTFKIWSIAGSQRCIYRSEILSPLYAPLSIHFDVVNRLLFVSAEDGTIRAFFFARHSYSLPCKKSTRTGPIEPRLAMKFHLDRWLSIETVASDNPNTAVYISDCGGRARVLGHRQDSGVSCQVNPSHFILAACAIHSALLVVTPSHFIIFSITLQQPILVQDLCQPLHPSVTTSSRVHGETAVVPGLARSAYILPSSHDSNGESEVHARIVLCPISGPTKRVILLHVSLSLLGTSQPISTHFLAILKSHFVDHKLKLDQDSRLDTLLFDSIQVTRGGALQPLDPWTNEIADQTLNQLSSVGVRTLGELLLYQSRWTRLILPIGINSVLRTLMSILQTPEIIPLIPVSELDSKSPLNKSFSNDKSCKPSLLDKPVTFHTKVRSSGYGVAKSPFSHLYMPKPKTPPVKPSPKRRYCVLTWKECVDKSVQSHVKVQDSFLNYHPSPITALRISNDGRFFAVGGVDGSMIVSKFQSSLLPKTPLNEPEIVCVCNMNQVVKSVSWSHNDQLLVAVTARTVRIWKPKVLEPNQSRKNRSIGGDDMTIDLPGMTPNGTTAAQFIHRSKFVLAAHTNRLELFAYKMSGVSDFVQSRLDITPRRPLGQSQSIWKQNAPQSAQQITAMAGWNCQLIPHAIFATSLKSLCVADLNVGKISSQTPMGLALDTSSVQLDTSPLTHQQKAIHSIALIDDPLCLPGPNLIVTTATGDLVRVWDVRTMTPVMRLGSQIPAARHLQEPGSSGAVLSPCQKWIAVPTNLANQAVCLFDVRMSKQVCGVSAHCSSGQGTWVCEKFKVNNGSEPRSPQSARIEAHGGILVGCVTFHPKFCQLWTGSSRGGLLSWSVA